MTEELEQPDEDLPKSKSAVKRELEAIRKVGVQLMELSDEQLRGLTNPKLLEAIKQAQRISRGSGRKRQIQYIGKLLRGSDLEEAYAILERIDASSREHNLHFHELERWREQLVSGDSNIIDEIAGKHPQVDRQHLRQLTRLAQQEASAGKPPAHFRKLFQYLRELSE